MLWYKVEKEHQSKINPGTAKQKHNNEWMDGID
jgi:hypothetical protein